VVLLSSGINPANDNSRSFDAGEDLSHEEPGHASNIAGHDPEMAAHFPETESGAREIIRNYIEFVNAVRDAEWSEPSDYFEEEALGNLANDIFAKLNAGCEWASEEDTPNEMQIHCGQIKEIAGADFGREFEARFLMEVTDRAGNWLFLDIDGSPYVMAEPALLAVSGSESDVGGNVLFSRKAFQELLERAERHPNLIPALLRAEINTAIERWSKRGLAEITGEPESLRFHSADQICVAECGEAMFLLSIGQNPSGTLAVQIEGVGFI
jgi:hypothetical protein